MLQNLLYFWNTKILFRFSFQATTTIRVNFWQYPIVISKNEKKKQKFWTELFMLFLKLGILVLANALANRHEFQVFVLFQQSFRDQVTSAMACLFVTRHCSYLGQKMIIFKIYNVIYRLPYLRTFNPPLSLAGP